MKRNGLKPIIFIIFILTVFSAGRADRRQQIYGLALELEKQASFLAETSFGHFKGWNNAISDEEQAVLFKSEAFLASCRLFLRLTEERSDYYRAGFLRTNLYNAFFYLTRAFQDLESSMRKAEVMPYELSACRRLLNAMDAEFSKWPMSDNLAYLHQRYVKGRRDAVYMIERRGPGQYVRRAFKDLESLFRYNYDLKRGKDPWKYLVEVSNDTLEKMEEGQMIDLTFEGWLIIEQSNRPNRPVYLIENGKKRGLTSPQVVQRFGGWGKVFEVPVEVVAKYPEGDPIT
ncbi:MAG: hypothetical protein QHH14_08305 [Clostridiales bacterium]|nr:hypothetical protein [Clostridiales bacterium]